MGFTPGKGKPTITSIHTLYKADSLPLNVPDSTIDSLGNLTVTVPQVQGVNSPQDSTTTSGNGGSYYVILGTNLGSTTSITFNDTAAFVNRAWLTDTTLIVAIPSNAWTPNEPNTLTVTTLYGSANTTFHVNQPAPNISGLNPSAAPAGDTITVNGSLFYNVDSVTFVAAGVDVQAQIVSYTPTQIQVVVPQGIVEAFVHVYTPGGAAVSPSAFGFKYVIYKDGLTQYWGGNGGGYSGYNSTVNYTDNSNPPPGGANDIMVTISGAYGALQIGYGGPTISVSTLDLQGIRFAIAGGSTVPAGGQPAQVVINGNYAANYQFTIPASTSGYQTFIIPLSALGNPSTISEVVIQMQGSGGAGIIFYVDNLGFI
ncbi:MAG TPA: IPT/TIG domain-containing protein [Puia sp.]|nr:IPT/TIG domain-containing protein [Puia sp.]